MLPEELIQICEETRSLKTESQTIELKSAHDGYPKKIYDTLSSFSNQDQGGTIIFGIDQYAGYEIVGVYDPHDLQQKVAEQAKNMTPPVRPLFTVAEIEGKTVVSAEIPGLDVSERPCFYSGKGRLSGSYCRVGDADEPMTEYEIYTYEAFRKNIQDDVRIIPDCSVDSFSTSALSNYLLRIRANKPNLSSLDDEHILRLMNMVRPDGVTLAAEWLLGLYPQAFLPQLCVIASVVPGPEMGDTLDDGTRFLDNKRIEGTIPDMLDEALSFVRKNLKTSTAIDPSTGKRHDRTDIPMLAVREVLLNALIHRDYSRFTENMPIQVVLYSDRLEVTNPGGLYGRLKVSELGQAQPDTRNPAIAVAMEVLGLTENRYSGIPTIKKEMGAYKLPAPEFIDTKRSFKVILRMRRDASGVAVGGTSKTRTGAYPTPKEREESLLAFCETPRTREEILDFLGAKTWSYINSTVVKPLMSSGELELTMPEKPQSKNQRFVRKFS